MDKKSSSRAVTTTSPLPKKKTVVSYTPPDEFKELDWKGDFVYPGMVKIGIIPDGSCFFHAIVNAFSTTYGLMTRAKKGTFIKELREELSKELPTCYDKLSRGKLKQSSQDYPRYSLESMQKELCSSHSTDNIFQEYLSETFEKDIYILDNETKDVYITGNDDEILYKSRPSVVILYLTNQNHFETIGINVGDSDHPKIETYFSPMSPFIMKIKQRMKDLRSK